MNDLSEKLSATLDYIKGHIEREGVPPMNAEIAENFGIAENTARVRVDALRKKGLIKIPGGRAMLIVDSPSEKAK